MNEKGKKIVIKVIGMISFYCLWKTRSKKLNSFPNVVDRTENTEFFLRFVFIKRKSFLWWESSQSYKKLSFTFTVLNLVWWLTNKKKIFEGEFFLLDFVFYFLYFPQLFTVGTSSGGVIKIFKIELNLISSALK